MKNQSLQSEMKQLNAYADDYDWTPFDQAMRHYMMRALGPHLRQGQALEMGCLHGEFTSILAEHYQDLTVVEAAENFIQDTRKRVGAHVKFVHSLFETYESEERFDAIFLLHVLEHLQNPVEVLQKAKSLLAPEGRIFLVVPNGGAVSRQIAVKMGVLSHLAALSDADTKHGHRRIYFLDTLEKDAQEAGLNTVFRGGIFFKPLANFQFNQLMGTDLINDDFMEGCYRLGMEHPSMCASIFVVCEA